MPTPKFSFIPEGQLGEKPKGHGTWQVSLLAAGTLYFPKDMVKILEMSGKYFKFFADVEKRAIGWVQIEGDTKLEELNLARLATPNFQNGAIIFAVRKILKVLGYPMGNKIKLEVKTYKSPLIPQDIRYVILPEIEHTYVPPEKEKAEDDNSTKKESW